MDNNIKSVIEYYEEESRYGNVSIAIVVYNSDDDTAKAKGRSLTWGMSEESAVFDEQDINKSNGISVRCLKDQ